MGQARLRGTKEQRVAALLAASGVKQLTPERYNAFIAWTRMPLAHRMVEEQEFFSNTDETLIGVLFIDRTDRDFAWAVLGRDAKGRFRWIDGIASLTRTEARHGLFAAIKRHTDSGKTVFPQGDEDDDKAGVDLFELRVAEGKLHKHFQVLRTLPWWEPAKRMLSEMMRHFTDVDGNFVEQFQSTAFDARLWELYLYAALLETGLYVSKEHEAPDFEVRAGGKKVFIEAVIVGPSPNDPPLEHKPSGMPVPHSSGKIKELLKTRMPIRFGSPLFSKLNRPKPYWELPHVQGHALVFAVADFHEDQSMTWTSPALLEYLYGVTHDFLYDEAGQLVITPLKLETHEYQGKVIPSGFFFQPNAEHVSAVLFSSSGTISKFNRMGRLAGFGPDNQRMFRSGVRHTHDANAALPTPFLFEIRQGVVQETWTEGLVMFHNPNAKHPIDPGMFPDIAHHRFQDGQIYSLVPEFHPYSSFTWNMLLTSKDAAEAAVATQA